MKKLSMRIVVVCFALIIACSYAMAYDIFLSVHSVNRLAMQSLTAF